MAKKSAKKADATEKTSGPGVLKKSVWHSGVMYSPKVKGDAEKFAAAIKAEADKSAAAKAAIGKGLQRLADKGKIAGFGTSAAAAKKAAADAEEPEVEEVTDEETEE